VANEIEQVLLPTPNDYPIVIISHSCIYQIRTKSIYSRQK